MFNQFNLYIGADNKTGDRQIEKIIALCNSHFIGFTLLESIGYWQGKRELSTVVTIFSEHTRFEMIEKAKLFATELNQDCIVCQSIISEIITDMHGDQPISVQYIDMCPSYSEE